MAAGIGEASAILAVAQLGIKLSNSLISYIGEVQDAPFRIQRISNEVATTSERLRDIGDLVAKNQQTNIFSEEGINSAIRCSDECRKIIEDVKSVLRKGGWQKSTAFDKEEIDTSLFSTLRWPFLKRSLEVPRAELQRIKIDLSLLFSSAMALGASTSHDKVKFSQDIPGLQKTRDWAARMADQARHRANDRSADFTSRGKSRDAYLMDDEPELLEDFVAYQERRIREEEDKRAQERAVLLQAQQEAKRKQEEEAKREIEQKAIDDYKKEQDELQTRTTESKETFRNELLRLGLQLDQIALIVDNSNLDFGGNRPDANVPIVRSTRGTMSGSTITHIDAGSTGSTNEETTPSRANGRSRRRLPWRNLRKPGGHESPEPSLDFVLSDGSSATNDSIMIETWLLDVFSNWKIEIMPSVEWVEKKFRKHRKREDVWHCFAGLKPLWRDAILQFLKARNDGNSVDWSLYLIELPQSNSKMGLRGFRGHKYDDQLVQVVLFKRKDSFDASTNDQGGTKYADSGQLHDEPNTPRPINSYFNQSLTSAQIHPQENQSERLSRPKVSFAQEVDERASNQNTVTATNEPLRFNTEEEVRNAIKRLGEKKKKLGATDQEHVDEINDMIVLLAAQLKLQHILSPSQRRILYGESGYDQTSATDLKSHPNTQLRNSEMNSRALFPEFNHNATAVTDRTEEISIPRDYRNRPIGKDATLSQVTRPQLERSRERRHFFDGEDTYVVYDSRQRPHAHEDTVIIKNEPRPQDAPIIINNEPRAQMPRYAGQDFGPYVPGKELVIRQNSPSRLGSSERRRPREYPPRDPDREWHYSPDRRGVVDQTYARNRPNRDEEIIIRRDERERYIPTREIDRGVDRDGEIIFRRDESERYFPHREEQILIPRDERLKRMRDRKERFKGERELIRREDFERERPKYERDEIIIRARTDSLSSADEVIRSQIPDPPRHTLRKDARSSSWEYIRPAVRRTSTFDDGTWPGVESKALVLRTGGARPTPGYMQEHILDRSIRVRGEQDVLSSPEYHNIKRLRSPTDSRHSSYSERDRAFLSRRPSLELYRADNERYATFATGKPFNTRKGSSHGRPRNRDLERVKNRHQRSRQTVSSSEDDDYLAMPAPIASKQQSKPSDEEVITQTLKRFTTFQGDQPPNATQSPSAADSSRRLNTAQNRDSTIDIDTQISKVRGLETMFEEPEAMTNTIIRHEERERARPKERDRDYEQEEIDIRERPRNRPQAASYERDKPQARSSESNYYREEDIIIRRNGREMYRDENIIIRRNARERETSRRNSLESDDELIVLQPSRITRDEEDIIFRHDESKGRHNDEIIIRRNERSPSPQPYDESKRRHNDQIIIRRNELSPSPEPEPIRAPRNGPRSPSQSPFYPSTNGFPPPPGPPRSPDSTSGSPRNPRAESRGRGHDIDVPVPPTYRPRDYYNFLNANAGDSPISPVPEPEHSNKVEIDSRRLRSDEVSPALKRSTRPAPNAVANGQAKGTKEPRITELSDGSSEDGRRKLHRKDRKPTVEDFEPDLEAGDMAAGMDLYD